MLSLVKLLARKLMTHKVFLAKTVSQETNSVIDKLDSCEGKDSISPKSGPPEKFIK